MNNKLQLVIDKIAEFTGMSSEQKSAFQQPIYEGLILNVVVDSENIVSKELFDKLKSFKKDSKEEDLLLTIQALFKELSETEEGVKLLVDKLFETYNVMIEPIKNILTDSQKAELLDIIKLN